MAEEKEMLATNASAKQDEECADDSKAGENNTGTGREHLATEERQSREETKQQLQQAFQEKHDAEVIGNSAEVSAAFEKARKESSDAAGQKSSHRTHGSQQGDGRDCRQRRRRNNAFSILLVRANTGVPVTRAELGSGSWREAIGELVGCPVDQKLSTVRNNHDRSIIRNNHERGTE